MRSKLEARYSLTKLTSPYPNRCLGQTFRGDRKHAGQLLRELLQDSCKDADKQEIVRPGNLQESIEASEQALGKGDRQIYDGSYGGS